MVSVKSWMRVSRVISMMYLRIVVRYRQTVEPQPGHILHPIPKLASSLRAEGPVDPDLADLDGLPLSFAQQTPAAVVLHAHCRGGPVQLCEDDEQIRCIEVMSQALDELAEPALVGRGEGGTAVGLALVPDQPSHSAAGQ